MLTILCGIAGLLIGSFLNVVVWRVPRGQSVVRPASACPSCHVPIRARDNLPVAGWLVLRGRCRDCHEPISSRYPIVELATGVLFAVLAVRFGFDPVLPAFLYLGAVGLALALIDLDTRRLPNALTLPSYPVGIVLLGAAALVSHDLGDLVRALLGMVALYSVYFALVFAYPAGMGFGDVKLAGVLGLFLGWLGWDIWAVGLFLGFVVGGVVGISLMMAGRAGRKSAIPFGPFMVTGALTAVVVGQPIAHVWLSGSA